MAVPAATPTSVTVLAEIPVAALAFPAAITALHTNRGAVVAVAVPGALAPLVNHVPRALAVTTFNRHNMPGAGATIDHFVDCIGLSDGGRIRNTHGKDGSGHEAGHLYESVFLHLVTSLLLQNWSRNT